MNKSALVALLVMLLNVPAFAGTETKDMTSATEAVQSDAGFYVGAYGGAEFATNYGNDRQTFDPKPPNGSPVFPTGFLSSAFLSGNSVSNDSIHSDYGAVGGIKAGYNFDSFAISDSMKMRLQPAVEAEALYLGTSSTSPFSGPAGTSNFIGFLTPFSTGGTITNSFNSAAFFVNGILRLKNSSIFTPYIGLGIGAEYITIHTDITDNFPSNSHLTGMNENDLDFAAQVLVGFDVAITKHFSLFTEYKFIDALGTDASTENVGSTGYTYGFKPDQIQQNVAVVGLKYTF
jgi:opacity protein-like surface antigen